MAGGGWRVGPPGRATRQGHPPPAARRARRVASLGGWECGCAWRVGRGVARGETAWRAWRVARGERRKGLLPWRDPTIAYLPWRDPSGVSFLGETLRGSPSLARPFGGLLPWRDPTIAYLPWRDPSLARPERSRPAQPPSLPNGLPACSLPNGPRGSFLSRPRPCRACNQPCRACPFPC